MCLTASELIWSRAPLTHCFLEQGNPGCPESDLTDISKTDANTRGKALSIQVLLLAFLFSQTLFHKSMPTDHYHPEYMKQLDVDVLFFPVTSFSPSLFPPLVLPFTQISHIIELDSS